MKYIFVVLVSIFMLSACARDNAVAMNLYTPDQANYEEASGVTAVITQDMIDRAKRR